jgi:hypothetical protein
MSIVRRPERILNLCGALFLFIGFLLMALVPDLTVAMSPRAGGTLLRARSWNRSALASEWLAALPAPEETPESDVEVIS